MSYIEDKWLPEEPQSHRAGFPRTPGNGKQKGLGPRDHDGEGRNFPPSPSGLAAAAAPPNHCPGNPCGDIYGPTCSLYSTIQDSKPALLELRYTDPGGRTKGYVRDGTS